MRDAVRRALEVCPVEVGIAVAGGDWKLTTVSKLADGPLRFGELQRAVGPVSAKTLTRQLRALETDGVVLRTVYPEVPPRVTYELTEAGRELATIATLLGRWSERFVPRPGPDAVSEYGPAS
ncbi:HxlR family transcriptional regulator [Isoptericola sp. CG 20/1183]|uniref:HxlR family transcriptional regulator n=1 Tax=Isoptericola halotolerans TaxID=300560 RepID=A0ABX5EGR1_9MICO|nr:MULTISPECIES: helix-turn-helix domain-containing protein [Isoptericola]MCK0116388.1 helix-turn-helix transcriptional regulator [Isoptericola sp. S6320L]PRZ08207.1 HxlR family transcriptional regulator [Isoptericola halotolerans]PRZ09004.1 HxlR family transcriptional regulator [Isoptericola sp. CG 20/1183]